MEIAAVQLLNRFRCPKRRTVNRTPKGKMNCKAASTRFTESATSSLTVCRNGQPDRTQKRSTRQASARSTTTMGCSRGVSPPWTGFSEASPLCKTHTTQHSVIRKYQCYYILTKPIRLFDRWRALHFSDRHRMIVTVCTPRVSYKIPALVNWRIILIQKNLNH